MLLDNRHTGGHLLADRLRAFRGPDIALLVLSPGGVAVAEEIAATLRAPLDVLVVNKPRDILGRNGLTDSTLDDMEGARPPRPQHRLERPNRRYTGIDLRGRTVVIVEDTLGGANLTDVRAATRAVCERGALRVVVAAPVAEGRAVSTLTKLVDKVICLEITDAPEDLEQWYRHDEPPTEADVQRVLEQHPGTADPNSRKTEPGVRTVTLRTFPWPTCIVAGRSQCEAS
ncbi:hypothetical protein VMT65_17555 [Nocardia sp. CDC153]|uniref:hypothetical protein n=1 Tax=Nocardia sp. CDC153 TaxID=3112167 RepID=UPI002DB69D39|nr:hypothetical protein [Nocardia sp. CDC153]MEC3954850.1 hypothetical protein [Nocardia sp. CDC153]